jgi:hypothetical protein
MLQEIFADYERAATSSYRAWCRSRNRFYLSLNRHGRTLLRPPEKVWNLMDFIPGFSPRLLVRDMSLFLFLAEQAQNSQLECTSGP